MTIFGFMSYPLCSCNNKIPEIYIWKIYLEDISKKKNVTYSPRLLWRHAKYIYFRELGCTCTAWAWNSAANSFLNSAELIKYIQKPSISRYFLEWKPEGGVPKFTGFVTVFEIAFLISLLIHEENTKENRRRIVFWYRGKGRP